jgi:hypothetical protein
MMRVDVDFAMPLDKAAKLRFMLAVSTLAKCRRVRFVRGDRGAAILGEALSARSTEAALKEHDFQPENVRSSLDPDEDLRADDPPEIMNGPEQVKAIGR